VHNSLPEKAIGSATGTRRTTDMPARVANPCTCEIARFHALSISVRDRSREDGKRPHPRLGGVDGARELHAEVQSCSTGDLRGDAQLLGRETCAGE